MARLIVAAVAFLAVALCGSVPASAAAGTSTAQAGSHSSGTPAAAPMGAVSAVRGVAAAESRARSYSRRTYDVGVYPWLYCLYLGARYQISYAERGYRAAYQCVYWGGVPPFHRTLLRVTVAF
ncbi:hypothetical protein [Streptomyces sp. NPDC085529]|uniref:hypothetical protein n=1 Tax=Streptomyces sp. NPDC085529 TaxID=3365729 RepID=UPI0037CF04A7